MRRFGRRTPGLTILALLLGGVSVSHAADLAEIQEEIETREARAREFRDEAKGLLGQLEGIDRELSTTRRSISELRTRGRRVQAELETVRGRIRDSEQRLERTQASLETRLVALYRWSAVRGVPAVYNAADFQTFVRRQQHMSRILAEDARLFSEHREARSAWLEERERGAVLVAELGAARRQLDLRQDRISNRLVERRNAVALLRSRADQEERLVVELREAAARLEATLAELPSEFEPPPGASAFAADGLVRPVAGAVRLRFGHHVDPEFGTEIVRNGIEIAAPLGEPVRAVAAGRVLFQGWFKGYGRIVILDHGRESVTVSGYLEESRVMAGDTVDAGAVIGTVGETGSLSGPGLYFEIRSRGEPVDPEMWLGTNLRGRMQ